MKNTQIPIYIAVLMCLAIPSVYAGPPVDIQDSDMLDKIKSCITEDANNGAITPAQAEVYRAEIAQYGTVGSMVTALKDEFLWISLFLRASFLEIARFIIISCVSFYVYWVWRLQSALTFSEAGEYYPIFLFTIACLSTIAGLLQAAAYKLCQNLYCHTMSANQYGRYLFYNYLIDNGFCSVKPDNMAWQIVQSILFFCVNLVSVVVLHPFFLAGVFLCVYSTFEFVEQLCPSKQAYVSTLIR